MIVVTGAAGHIGNTLVRALLEKGHKVRCLVMPREGLEPLAGLDVEIVEGDVRDRASLVKAFAGASVVYHLASIISLVPGRSSLLTEVNVNGTANVVAACRECGVGRLVYTSSIHAFAEPPKGVAIDESAPIDPKLIKMEYGRTKAQATRVVLEAAAEGLDAVVVCPTGVIGPHDYKRSEMGQLFIGFARGLVSAYVDGAYDFVDVRDVAEGLIAACERGRRGEVYILSGELITVKELVKVLAQITRRPAPRLRAPAWLADLAAALATPIAKLLGERPVFTRESLITLRSNPLATHAKATRELGWVPRPIRRSIADAIDWFRSQGMIRTRRATLQT